jgi:hypothetical protein
LAVLFFFISVRSFRYTQPGYLPAVNVSSISDARFGRDGGGISDQWRKWILVLMLLFPSFTTSFLLSRIDLVLWVLVLIVNNDLFLLFRLRSSLTAAPPPP